MYQIDDPTASSELPTPGAPGTPGYFTEGDAAGGVEPTIVTADFLNALMLEVLNVITAGGIAPAKGVNNQLLASLHSLIESRHSTSLDTGVANAYVISETPMVTSYSQGQSFSFIAAHTNTAASTFDAGAGPAPLVRFPAMALEAGDIVAGQPVVVTYETGVGFVSNSLLLSDFLRSPAFRGAPTAPTPPVNDNSQKLAPTNFVQAAIAAATLNSTPQVVIANMVAGTSGDLWTYTAAGALQITLPDPPVGNNPLRIRDAGGTWDVHNLTIASGTKSIIHPFGVVVGNLICDTAGEVFGLWYDGTNWRII